MEYEDGNVAGPQELGNLGLFFQPLIPLLSEHLSASWPALLQPDFLSYSAWIADNGCLQQLSAVNCVSSAVKWRSWILCFVSSLWLWNWMLFHGKSRLLGDRRIPRSGEPTSVGVREQKYCREGGHRMRVRGLSGDFLRSSMRSWGWPPGEEILTGGMEES